MGSVTTLGAQLADRRVARLASHLRARGSLTESRWEAALREVPRYLFVPAKAYFTSNHVSAPRGVFDVDNSPDAWWDAVYSDTSAILQADDGNGDPASGKGLFSSSVSAPGIVFPFLELLNPRKGERFLEIGTGSGWTAGLLSWAAGARSVTTVEVDPAVAAQAKANLRRAGIEANLIIADGFGGWPECAPYDGVHVAAGVTDIPLAWIEQTRPGGRIVLPWHGTGITGHQLRLTVADASTATGRFHGTASYMMLRDQRFNARWLGHHYSDANESATRINPRVIAEAELGAHLLWAALAPRIGWYGEQDGGDFTLQMYELDDHSGTGSWAECAHRSGTSESRVRQYGKRRLWDELSSAYQQWVSLGEPAYDRFGVTVDPGGTHFWLDGPSAPGWKVPAT